MQNGDIKLQSEFSIGSCHGSAVEEAIISTREIMPLSTQYLPFAQHHYQCTLGIARAHPPEP